MGSWKNRLVLLAIILCGSGSLSAQNVPRVLILGDGIHAAPAAEMAKNLKGRAEVVYPPMQPGEVRNTATALKELDRFLGTGKWDVIHFNFGLGDLMHRAPGMENFRALPKEAGGVPAVDLEQYQKNLQEIVTRLKKTGATLIWASTTPVAKSPMRIFEPGSEIEYNLVAAKVMAANGVAVNDLHAYVAAKLKDTDARRMPGTFEIDKPAPLAAPITEAILAHLH